MAKFCPECGKPTTQADIGGRGRAMCTDGHFVQFAKTAISVAALAFRDDTVLLVQHNHPSKVWSMAGGYIEQEEDLELALVREVEEESGVTVKPQGMIALRQLVKPNQNELYIIFLCDVDDEQDAQAPHDEEIIGAKFVPLRDIPDWNITPFTRRIVEGYLDKRPDTMLPFEIEGYLSHAFMFGNV